MKTPYATPADLFAIPEGERHHELLAGELVRKALPVARHGASQLAVGEALGPFRRRPGGPRGPGGWRFASECEIQLGPDTIVRSDVAGWRRERLPRLPDTFPCRVRPDWVCEVLSRSNAVVDLLDKVRIYHEAAIPHYWILDSAREALRVHRWAELGYRVVLDRGREALVRAEPFEAIELLIADLFDDVEDDESPSARGGTGAGPDGSEGGA